MMEAVILLKFSFLNSLPALGGVGACQPKFEQKCFIFIGISKFQLALGG